MSEEKIEVPEQNYGPGNVLRAKREEYEWSIEAVAEALQLGFTRAITPVRLVSPPPNTPPGAAA